MQTTTDYFRDTCGCSGLTLCESCEWEPYVVSAVSTAAITWTVDLAASLERISPFGDDYGHDYPAITDVQLCEVQDVLDQAHEMDAMEQHDGNISPRRW